MSPPDRGGERERALDSFRERVDATVSTMAVETGRPETGPVNVSGVPYRMQDVAVSGEVDGYVVLDGPVPNLVAEPYSWLHDSPDISLPQEHLFTIDRHQPYPLPLQPGDGNTARRQYARARFLATDGSGMSLLLPADVEAWNGKLFVVQHGSGEYTPIGPLVDPAADGVWTAGLGANLFAGVMVNQGYAVAYLRKDAIRPPRGVSEAGTEDGLVLRTTFVPHVALAVALVEVAQDLAARALGATPTRTYYYGHSGGAITGRLMNYAPHANVRSEGAHVIDGFLLDDAGNGLYLPVAYRGSEDRLLTSDAQRAEFAPQIDITRQLYHPRSYREAKRQNAQLLRDKGLGDRHRHYEVRGTSHFDAGQADEAGSGRSVDLGPLVHALVERLDGWVDCGIEPPASRADVPGCEPAIALPEVACPLGVYHTGPPGERGVGAAAKTAFASFDGQSLEPVDSDTGEFVDMNGNGVRDRRETVDAAWRRLGLLDAGEDFGEQLYTDRLADAAARLERDGFLPSGARQRYRRIGGELLAASGARWARDHPGGT